MKKTKNHSIESLTICFCLICSPTPGGGSYLAPSNFVTTKRRECR